MLQCLRLVLLIAALCCTSNCLAFRGGGRPCVRGVTAPLRTRECFASSGTDGEGDGGGVPEQVASKFITAPESSAPQGYLSSDMNKMEDGKQNRVLAYIGLALIPCLFLVPFFLSRDFVPPTIE